MEEIYREYAQGVYGYLCRLTGDADAASELTSETFYQAMRSIHRFDGRCRMLTWLCQIGKHLWYRELARRKKQRPLPLEDAAPLADGGPTPEQALVHDEGETALYVRMRELDSDTREVMYLRLLGGLPYRRIGEILGRTETWARVAFYRGKEKLKKAYGDET